MAKFTMEELMAGKVDARKLKLADVVIFMEENEIDMPVSQGDGVKKTLNALCDWVEAKESPPVETPPQEEPPAATHPTFVPEPPEPKKSTGSPFLDRRAKQIAAAQASTGQQSGKVNAAMYDDNAPDFLKRRFGGAK